MSPNIEEVNKKIEQAAPVADEKLTAFEFRGAWGVCGKSSILYDASFAEATAKELARLENLPRAPMPRASSTCWKPRPTSGAGSNRPLPNKE
jgi:hypothetical protein